MNFLPPPLLDAFFLPPHGASAAAPSRAFARTPRYTVRAASASALSAALEVELPGVSREHVRVEVDGDHLIVRGKRLRNRRGTCAAQQAADPDGNGNGNDKPVVAERYLLVLRLARAAQKDAIKAEHCSNGIVVVTIPIKKPEVRTVDVA